MTDDLQICDLCRRLDLPRAHCMLLCVQRHVNSIMSHLIDCHCDIRLLSAFQCVQPAGGTPAMIEPTGFVLAGWQAFGNRLALENYKDNVVDHVAVNHFGRLLSETQCPQRRYEVVWRSMAIQKGITYTTRVVTCQWNLRSRQLMVTRHLHAACVTVA